jgi:transposase-like protein
MHAHAQNNDLPPPGTQRWVVRHKAAIVDAVRSGAVSLADACRTYQLSPEEFNSWQRLIDRDGPRALRATRLQDYRSPERLAQPA